ncbi:MAG: PfkB family carbohydrate kinase [Acutalibacteraceae bacterium]|nr:PfkB family carbohydrate kinase [Acutalibacteraceae bacterium]
MKILNFGSCNIDYVYSLEHIVNVGETETTHKLEVFPGGKGLNQSIAVAKAGAKICHAGCVGYDGEMLTDILSENGVDITYLKTVDSKNGHAVIQVSSKGENSIFLYPGSNEMITKDHIDAVLENFRTGDFLILQNEINDVDYIVEKAYKKGMCIILNPSPFNEKIRKINLSMLSYLVINEVELVGISGCSELEEGLATLKNRFPTLKIILTLGENGSVLYDGSKEIWQPSYKVNVVDTTSAGDTFLGYFVAELSKGKEYSQILKTASAASAITVSRKGAAPSIPNKDEVMSLFDGLKESKSNPKSKTLYEQIDRYIEQNIKTANLEELSQILGYSTVYTGRIVNKLMGENFAKVVIAKRCKMAAHMLLNTNHSVHDIIGMVGYENESFFRKTFKQKYGKTPLEYRKARN